MENTVHGVVDGCILSHLVMAVFFLPPWGIEYMPLLFSLLCTQRNGVGELIYTHEGSDPGVAIRLHGARKQKEFFFSY